MADENVQMALRVSDEQVLASLKRIEGSLDRLASRGEGSLNRINRSMNRFAVVAGAVAGVVTNLVNSLLNMGRRGADAIGQLIKEGINLAMEFEQIEARVQGFFRSIREIGEGGEPIGPPLFTEEQVRAASDLVLAETRRLQRQLGLEAKQAQQITARFLPRVENVAQLRALAEFGTFLQTIQPEATAFVARAIEDMVESGSQFQTIRRVFELPESFIDRARELKEQYGDVTGSIMAAQELQEQWGFDLKNLQNTGKFALNQIKSSAADLLLVFSQPLAANLGEQLVFIRDAFIDIDTGDFRADIEEIARLGGEAFGFLVDIIGDDLQEAIASIDSEDVLKAAEDFRTMVFELQGTYDQLKIIAGDVAALGQDIADLLNTLAEFNPSEALFGGPVVDVAGAIPGADSLFSDEQLQRLEEAGKNIEDINTFMIQLTGVTAFVGSLFDDVLERMAKVPDVLAGIFQIMEGIGSVQFGLGARPDQLLEASEQVNKAWEDVQENLGDLLGSQIDMWGKAGEAASEAMAQAAEAQVKAVENAKDLSDAYDEAAESADNLLGVGEEIGNLALGYRNIETQLEALTKEFDEAADKIEEATEKIDRQMFKAFERNRVRRERGIRDAEQDRLDAEADQEIKHQNRLEKIRRKGDFDREGAIIQFDRRTRDLAKEHEQELIDLEEESRDERKEIIRDYWKEVEKIETQYGRDVEDAVRERDGVALIDARRRRRRALEDAETDRRQELEDERIAAEDKQKELEAQQRREREKLDQQERDRLEDLMRRLAFRISEERKANDEEVDQIILNEQRKRDAAIQAEKDANEDAVRRAQEARKELEVRYKDEFAILAKNRAEIEALEKEKAAILEKIANDSYTQRNRDLGTYLKNNKDLWGAYYGETESAAKEHQKEMEKYQMPTLGRSVTRSRPIEVPSGQFYQPLLNFDEGGIVPGPAGRAQSAIVHGGEMVIPQQATRQLLNQSTVNQQRTVNNNQSVQTGDISFGDRTPAEMFLDYNNLVRLLKRSIR